LKKLERATTSEPSIEKNICKTGFLYFERIKIKFMMDYNQYKDREVLAYTPIGMKLEKYDGGWGTFLFTSSRACNLSCEGCWTSTTNELIRKQLRAGADWLYDGSCGVNVLEAMLGKFANEGGRLVANMSDGKPLIPANYGFILELTKQSSKQGLPLLLFTNGHYLTEEKMQELTAANRKISYCISIQTGISNRYDNFMLSERLQNTSSADKLFEKLERNYGAWIKYDQKILQETGNHGIAIHTYIIPEKTTEADMEAVKLVVEILGNVPWIVTNMGIHTSRSLRRESIQISDSAFKLKIKYDTRPTATLNFGEGEYQKLCSYISHGFYPFEEEKGVFGITFNPYQRGQVQTCPYHSAIGTNEWFNLRDYLDSMKQSGQQITDEHIGRWLENAVKVETMVTQAAFDLAGYEHCFMRHSRKPEIDLLISGVNIEMAKRRKERRFDIKDKEYFINVIENLSDAIQIVATKLGA